MKNDQKGAIGMLGLILSLVAVLILGVMLAKSQGLLGVGKKDGSDPRDQAVVAGALIELRQVKMGLEMKAQMPDSSFPETAEINTMDDLRAALASTLPLGADPSFTFVSYARADPDSFTLVVKAKDSVRSVLEVTASGPPRRRP